MGNIKYSIAIPVYNSGDWLDELVNSICEVMDSTSDSYEIVLVNDGSPDVKTWPIMKGLVEKYSHIKVINLHYNSGQLNALLCAMKHTSGEYVITMDDDFQHDPNEIIKLINRIKETDSDVVLAQYIVKEHSFIRRLGSGFANYLSCKIYHKPKNVTSNSFRILKRSVVEALISYRGKNPQIGPMIFLLKPKIETVAIEHKQRKYGKSGYSAYRLIKETVNIILNGSTFFVDLIASLGLVISFVSLAIALFYLIKFLAGGIGVPGYTSQILIMTFFSGIITMSIGVVGKYVGKIVHEISGFPPYLEAEVIKSDDNR